MFFSRRIGFLAVLLPLASACPADSHFSMSDFTKQYCSQCHNSEDWAGGIAFDTIPLSDVHANRDVWEKVIRKMRVGMTSRERREPSAREAAAGRRQLAGAGP